MVLFQDKLNPLYKTFSYSVFVMVVWNRSRLMDQRLEYEGKIVNKDGKPHYIAEFEGNQYVIPIIRRDSPIVGGVCMGASEREAFYVAHVSGAINGMKENVRKRASYDGMLRRSKILRSIFEEVKESLPYDSGKVDQIVRNKGVENDGLISIGEFIRGKAGVCRHQAVASAALMEHFGKYCTDNNRLRGKPSVDRNGFGGSAHTWARYTSYNGSVIILDVAQDFISILNESTKNAIEEGKLWNYNRPDDILFHED